MRSWSLLAASDGSLWFGRVEGGLLRLRNGAWRRYEPGSGTTLADILSGAVRGLTSNRAG